MTLSPDSLTARTPWTLCAAWLSIFEETLRVILAAGLHLVGVEF